MIRISAISFLNSLPFARCLELSALMDAVEISYDTPSQCADKLLSDRADIGLIPIVETLKMPQHYVISDYCIGARQAVRTVALVSDAPLEKIETVYLDSHSRTSVILAKILAQYYWRIEPQWIDFEGDIANFPHSDTTAAVMIGDKVFNMSMPHTYDLVAEWIKFTGLPFVFACWVANKFIDKDFVSQFNKTFLQMTDNMPDIALHYKHLAPDSVDLLNYWTTNISYTLTAKMREGMELFLKYARQFFNHDKQEVL